MNPGLGAWVTIVLHDQSTIPIHFGTSLLNNFYLDPKKKTKMGMTVIIQSEMSLRLSQISGLNFRIPIIPFLVPYGINELSNTLITIRSLFFFDCPPLLHPTASPSQLAFSRDAQHTPHRPHHSLVSSYSFGVFTHCRHFETPQPF